MLFTWALRPLVRLYQRKKTQFFLQTRLLFTFYHRPLKLKKKTTEISTLDGVGDGDDDVDEELREELYSTAYKKIIKEVIKVVVANHTKLDEALLDEGVNHIWNISSEIYEVNWSVVSKKEHQAFIEGF